MRENKTPQEIPVEKPTQEELINEQLDAIGIYKDREGNHIAKRNLTPEELAEFKKMEERGLLGNDLSKTGVKTSKEYSNYRQQTEANEPDTPESTKKENLMNRRDFLKLSALTAGALAVKGSSGPIRSIIETLKSESESGLEKNEKPDTRTFDEVLDFDSKEPVAINLQTYENTKNEYRDIYETGSFRFDLDNALYNMEKDIEILKQKFNEHGVPEKYLYLAIPESNWNAGAVSEDKATGHYQITPATAKSYGMKNIGDKTKDERRDPIKSGEVCAMILKDLYTKYQDWNLALSGYNGGLIKKYMYEYTHEREEPSYGEYLMFLENAVKSSKDSLKENDQYQYNVRPKENLYKISKHYGYNFNDVAQLNNISKPYTIKVGQIIKLPTKKQEDKKRMFDIRMSDIKQNLNYVAKVNGVIEAIKNIEENK